MTNKKTTYTSSHSLLPKAVLDTHVFLWLMQGDKRLSSKSAELINKYGRDNALYLPAICLWEVALLDKRKRIKLHQPCSQWLHEAINKPGLLVMPLSLDIALESVALPDNFHNDPADRLIVATARVLNAKLITRDSKILEYAEAGFIQCIEV